MPDRGPFKLDVSLDASGIEGYTPGRSVKVVAHRGDQPLSSAVTALDEKGRGVATLTFEEHPGAVRVSVGPHDASDLQIVAMQTLSVDVGLRHWGGRAALALPALRITAFYWRWWLRWCRKITVHGRVLCADGSPTPGVQVTAFDVDAWWWWSSRQQLAVSQPTAADGSFTLELTWCCGLWPWWWWRERAWRVDPRVAEHIFPLLRSDPALRALPRLSPVPDLRVFEALVADKSLLRGAAPGSFDPSLLPRLRSALLERLPRSAELDRLGIWPWAPWTPWWDCSPGLNFKGVQTCGDRQVVAFDEGLGDVREVPTTTSVLDVTLTAGPDACCIVRQPPRPPGGCLIFDSACRVPSTEIGGNPTGTTTVVAGPAGYDVAGGMDRPFAGTVTLYGTLGQTANADYYEVEVAPLGGGFATMPPAAFGGFRRYFWGPPLAGGPVGQQGVDFAPHHVPGISSLVLETQDHFEASNDPSSWGISRFWMDDPTVLMNLLPENVLADGAYRFQLKAWTVSLGGPPQPTVLPLCDTEPDAEVDNSLVLRLDNRAALPDPQHPLGPAHPSGAGTVHTATTEPDTDITSVRVGTVSVGACAKLSIAQGDLIIDFLAHDPDGHLDHYTLAANYGDNLTVDLLALVGTAPGDFVLTPGPAAGLILPAAQVGPGYLDARAQGAPRPEWKGGSLRLTIPQAALRRAFPEPCCYQLELRAYKRNIVSCSGEPYQNLSEYTFLVID